MGLNKQEYPSFSHWTTDLWNSTIFFYRLWNSTIHGFVYLGTVPLTKIGLLGLETQAIWHLTYMK